MAATTTEITTVRSTTTNHDTPRFLNRSFKSSSLPTQSPERLRAAGPGRSSPSSRSGSSVETSRSWSMLCRLCSFVIPESRHELVRYTPNPPRCSLKPSTYIRIYVYTCIPLYIYTYIPIYLYTYIHIYIYTYIHVYIYLHIYISTYTHIYIYTYYTCIHVYIYTYRDIYMYIHIYINIYTDIQIYSYICI